MWPWIIKERILVFANNTKNCNDNARQATQRIFSLSLGNAREDLADFALNAGS